MNRILVFLLFLVISVPLTVFVSRGGIDESLKRIVSADSFDPTTLHFIIFLDGIGGSGDGINPDSIGSNKDPELYIKRVKITVYNQESHPVIAKTEVLKFDYGRGAYLANLELGEEELPKGDYVVKVKVDGYLQRAFPMKEIDTHNAIAFPPVSLVAGDLNGNNKLDVIDYHILTGCYSDVLPPTFCSPGLEVVADLSSDGKVNQKDYNLFMREISVYEKGE